MKKSAAPPPSEPLVLKDAPAGGPTLEFPIDPGFLSLPPRLDPQAMLRRIEENLPWRTSRPGERERRATEAIAVEFVL
jgi:hypothetical protein